MKLKCVLDKGAFALERAHETDAGFDIRTPICIQIPPRAFRKINTGVHVECPRGYMTEVRSKSGLMAKKGILTDGTIDTGYTGEVGVVLFNLSDEFVTFERGDKIAQLVTTKLLEFDGYEVTDSLEDSERGNGGFGSTGR